MNSKVVLLIAAAAALTAAGIVACGGGSNPVAPPSGTPTTTTTTTRPTQPVPVCNPSPPPLYGVKVKVHSNGDGYRRILDARPLVVNVDGFCQRVGQSGRFCFTRIEGDFDMAQCDQAAMGAANTGRWGPTWYYEDQLCSGSSPGCTDHPDNQFLLIAKGSGSYSACAADNIPVSQDPSIPGSRCGGCTLRDGDTDCE
jgi:hypothetical protein